MPRPRLGLIAIHHPTNAITQMHDIEVDQQAHGDARQFQIRQELRAVKRMQFFNCRQLEDDAIFDQVIDAETRLDGEAPVPNRQLYLSSETERHLLELVTKASVIGFFDQPGSDRRVHRQCASDYARCDVIDRHQNSSACSASSAVERTRLAQGTGPR
jgi:hypothetical protein